MARENRRDSNPHEDVRIDGQGVVTCRSVPLHFSQVREN